MKEGMVVHVSCAGKDRERAGFSEITGARRHSQLGHPRDLKPTHMIGGYVQQSLWLQLLRHRRFQPRRICHRPQDEKVDWMEGPLAEGETAA
jgi:hypothetical protein